MRARRQVTIALLTIGLLAPLSAAADSAVLWQDNDAQPIPEPAEDLEADSLWWDGARHMTEYQLERVLDLDASLRRVGTALGAVGPREAANRNALDEVPDSTWFVNRHAREPLDLATLRRGPNLGPPPAPGPLAVVSGKKAGATPGFIVRDTAGRRYLIKFDHPDTPELATGAEVVSSKLLWALGWNSPEYHVWTLDPSVLRIEKGAKIRGKYGVKRPLVPADIDAILELAAKLPDGRIRVVASTFIEGVPKGGFRNRGTRVDDPNDTVPHQHRRDLRGLKVVAAWINYTDARRGNFFDSFVTHPGDPEGRGHIVHYLLDFSSTLGSGNTEWKSPKLGNEYFFDPPWVLWRTLTLGAVAKPWENPPLTHPALGYFEGEFFDPENWVTTYPQPLFDHATVLDEFWGAKLVHSLRDDELQAIVETGEWSDPEAARLLWEVLRQRRQRIAEAYFDSRRINPADRFDVEGDWLGFTDWAVEAGVSRKGRARYRSRRPGGEWQISLMPSLRLAPAIEMQSSHDGGQSWSPSTHLEISKRKVVRIRRETR